MAMVNTKQKAAELYAKRGDNLAFEMADYAWGASYWCDVIGETADSLVDIYYSDLRKWIREDGDSAKWMDEAINSGFCDTTEYDFYKHVRAAQYLAFKEAIYKGLDEYGVWLAFDIASGSRSEISEAAAGVLENLNLSDFSDKTFDDFKNAVMKVLKMDAAYNAAAGNDDKEEE